MIIGVPKEVKEGEFRVAMTPDGVRALTRSGHGVCVQAGAGGPSGFSDQEYRRAGAAVVTGASAIWSADLVIKVKEPLPGEFRFFKAGQILFAFLHLAAKAALAKELLKKKLIAVGYETVEDGRGGLPILQAMSEIAGRVAVLMGAYFQGNPQGGRGVLFSGVQGIPPAHVVVLGGGTVGENAARVAVAMGSRVTILEHRPQRRRYLKSALRSRARVCAAETASVKQEVMSADILIGALHLPGARTPRLVNRRLVRKMKPSSVIVDVAIDQGGCCETSRPTSHLKPTFRAEGVLHYCVPNIPGAYARTATLALTYRTLPYVLAIARRGLGGTLKEFPGLTQGIQCYRGHLINRSIGEAQGLKTCNFLKLLEKQNG